METYCLVVAESESLARTRQLQRMLKCSSLCKVCFQELKTGNQLQRQQLPSAQVKQNENPVQLGKAKCRLASKQILHFSITVRASSEMLLRWSLLMCINPVLLPDRRYPCALVTKSEELPEQWTAALKALPLLLMCSKPGAPCDSLGLSQEEFWSDTTPPSFQEGRATT